MAKGVFVHRADSVYDDFPEARYQFPKGYLKRVSPCEGDWIVYYEPRGGGGRLGYNAIAKVQEIIPDPSIPDMFIAVIEAGSYLPLEQFVSFRSDNGFLESALAKPDGRLTGASYNGRSGQYRTAISHAFCRPGSRTKTNSCRAPTARPSRPPRPASRKTRTGSAKTASGSGPNRRSLASAAAAFFANMSWKPMTAVAPSPG